MLQNLGGRTRDVQDREGVAWGSDDAVLGVGLRGCRTVLGLHGQCRRLLLESHRAGSEQSRGFYSFNRIEHQNRGRGGPLSYMPESVARLTSWTYMRSNFGA